MDNSGFTGVYARYNGHFELDYQGPLGCIWESDLSLFGVWQLFVTPSGEWQLIAFSNDGGAASVLYCAVDAQGNPTPFNCNAPNTMCLCATPPTPPPPPCASCNGPGDLTPSSYTLALAGFPVDGCFSNAMNGTWTLKQSSSDPCTYTGYTPGYIVLPGGKIQITGVFLMTFQIGVRLPTVVFDPASGKYVPGLTPPLMVLTIDAGLNQPIQWQSLLQPCCQPVTLISQFNTIPCQGTLGNFLTPIPGSATLVPVGCGPPDCTTPGSPSSGTDSFPCCVTIAPGGICPCPEVCCQLCPETAFMAEAYWNFTFPPTDNPCLAGLSGDWALTYQGDGDGEGPCCWTDSTFTWVLCNNGGEWTLSTNLIYYTSSSQNTDRQGMDCLKGGVFYFDALDSKTCVDQSGVPPTITVNPPRPNCVPDSPSICKNCPCPEIVGKNLIATITDDTGYCSQDLLLVWQDNSPNYLAWIAPSTQMGNVVCSDGSTCGGEALTLVCNPPHGNQPRGWNIQDSLFCGPIALVSCDPFLMKGTLAQCNCLSNPCGCGNITLVITEA